MSDNENTHIRMTKIQRVAFEQTMQFLAAMDALALDETVDEETMSATEEALGELLYSFGIPGGYLVKALREYCDGDDADDREVDLVDLVESTLLPHFMGLCQDERNYRRKDGFPVIEDGSPEVEILLHLAKKKSFLLNPTSAQLGFLAKFKHYLVESQILSMNDEGQVDFLSFELLDGGKAIAAFFCLQRQASEEK